MSKIELKLFNKENVALEVEHLFGVYNENKESQYISLTDINFSFQKNKIYFIIGNSGSGKSTLVTHFNGLLKSKYGNIFVQNNYPIGKSLFIQDWLLGVINPNDIANLIQHKNIQKILKRYKNSQYFVVACRKNLAKSLVQILFEGYFKSKLVKVKPIKLKKQPGYFYLVFLDKDNEFELDVQSYLSLSDIHESEIIKSSSLIDGLSRYFYHPKIKKIKKLRKTVGMVFQFPEYQLFKDTIQKDIMFGPIALGDSKEHAKLKAKKYLNELGLPDSYLTRSPFGLSGGQKRRVAIAGILAIEPEILIFDEPTAGLDPMGEAEMLKIISNAKDNGKTVIVITHTMDHVLQIADEVIVMNDGEIIKHGEPYEIFTDKELLETTSIESPRIIEVINELSQANDKYKVLYELKPRTIEELANNISKIINTK